MIEDLKALDKIHTELEELRKDAKALMQSAVDIVKMQNDIVKKLTEFREYYDRGRRSGKF